MQLLLVKYLTAKRVIKLSYIGPLCPSSLLHRTSHKRWTWFSLLDMGYRLYTCHWTLWGRDRMVAFLQTKFSNQFCHMKIVVFWYEFYWNMFAWVHHWFRYWLSAGQTIIWTDNSLVYLHIYPSFGLNAFDLLGLITVHEKSRCQCF